MLLRDLKPKQIRDLQNACNFSMRAWCKTHPEPSKELWQRAFTEGVKAILSKLDKLDV